MENQLTVFDNKQFGKIRTLEENSRILFCGKDVAVALGYSNTNDALARHCRVKGVVKHDTLTNGGKQELTFIDEGNLYRLITHSKLPEAEKFESWVFDEVLPTIRKTGGYISNEDTFINTYLPNADEQTKIMIKSNLETIRSLNNQIEQDKPKVLFANAVETAHTSILVGELAKLLRQNGVQMGQNRLFDWLRAEGYLIKGGSSRNMPTQYAMERGLFEVMERTVSNPDGSVRITKTPKVTGKGQIYFIKKLTEAAV